MQKRIQKEIGNNCLKRIIVAFLAVIMMTTMLHPQMVQAATGITIESKDNKVPTYKAGEKKTWTFTVTNHSGNTMNNVTVTPDLGDDNDVWPFKTEMQSYQQNIGTLKSGESNSKEVKFDFTQREDVQTSRYTLKFKVTADGQEEAEKQKLLEELKGKENVTPDGRKINIYANIGSVGDLGYVMENDAGGIGLFRSEFLYLGRNDFPTEEEQFQAYKQAVQMMAGKKVIIRTLDIGADKQVDYFNLGNEDNPAMGYRAIRICLRQPEIFKTQLRALLRAAVYGNLSIMYPMITSTEEVKKIYEIVAEVEEELKAQEIQYKIPEQGIMIETPAAAIISDKLAEMVDFFSIGTNDLTQYTLAIDRQNEKLDEFYNPHHEAILRMIQMVLDNAHKCGKWAGICGELGADATLTEQFVRMGLDELSVAPSMVLKLRKIVREMKVEE